MSDRRVARHLRLAATGLCLLTAGCVTRSGEQAQPAMNESYRAGRLNLAAGNAGLAERNFRDAVERNPQDRASWIGLAAAYDNLGRFELADRTYARAIELGGETLQILNNRGYSYMLRGNGTAALAQFERALELDPGNPVTGNNISLLRLGQRPTRSAPF